LFFGFGFWFLLFSPPPVGVVVILKSFFDCSSFWYRGADWLEGFFLEGMSKRVALVVESLWEILICVKLCFHFALCCIWAAFHLIIVYWDVFHIGFEREIEFSLLWNPLM